MARKAKTPEEMACGLECIRTNVERVCVKPEKGQCPRCEQFVGETLDLIQQLEAEAAKQTQRIAELEQELAAVKRERDAAVTDMRKMAISKFPCNVCSNDHQNDPVCKSHQGDCSECSVHCPCDGCFDDWEMEFTGNNFAWRGVCPENTKEDK